MRRAFALARFCTTYEMQLASGVNVIDSLASVGKTSQSALVNEVTQRALPQVRGGSQVGPLLAGSDAFTHDMVRSFMVGEETGSLDVELKRMAGEFQVTAMSKLDLLGGIFAKGVYFAVVIYAAYIIISFWLGYFNTLTNIQ
jgi:type IV pilus assembly protein PilC